MFSMGAIRQINPEAKLVQTEDISMTYGTPKIDELAGGFNQRSW